MERRRFLIEAVKALLFLPHAGAPAATGECRLRLALCGDVMTGRGVDQALPHSVDPVLYERYVKSAAAYVALAEEASGPIPRPVSFSYVWGDVAGELERASPDLFLANLETSITTSDEPWPGKGIHYRMHPGNVACLTAGGIGGCALSNNHVLDWGRAGLEETLAVLGQAGITAAGAGRDLAAAEAPAVFKRSGNGRVLFFSYGLPSSGIPPAWAAADRRSGVSLLEDLSARSVRQVAARVAAARRPGDVVVLSLHWGGNWGYAVSARERDFAHRLVGEAGVDLLHGHSSHHPKGMEVVSGRLILYGCGDFLNDYEGISGYESFRDDLVLLYLADLESTGRLVRLEMAPFQIHRLSLRRPAADDVEWLRQTLDRECRKLGARVAGSEGSRLRLEWRDGRL